MMGIPRTRGLLKSSWQPLGIPSAITSLSQLHQSPPSPIPGDRAHGKQRDFSAAAAARHSQSTRVNTDFPKQHPFTPKNKFFPDFSRLNLLCSGPIRFVRGGSGGAVGRGAKSRPQGECGQIGSHFCRTKKIGFSRLNLIFSNKIGLRRLNKNGRINPNWGKK